MLGVCQWTFLDIRGESLLLLVFPADGRAQDHLLAGDSRLDRLQRLRGADAPHDPFSPRLQQQSACGPTARLHRAAGTHRHDLPPLPNDAVRRIHKHTPAVEAPAGLLDQAHDQEHAGLRRDALQLLARPVAGALPVHARAVGTGVAEVDGLLPVLVVLRPALAGARANHGAEAAGARVPAEEGFGEEKQVHAGVGGGDGDRV